MSSGQVVALSRCLVKTGLVLRCGLVRCGQVWYGLVRCDEMRASYQSL